MVSSLNAGNTGWNRYAQVHRAQARQEITERDLENRNFRGFRNVDVNRMREMLPPAARHLAGAFIDAARRNNLDPVVLAAIARHETANFTSNAFRTRNNAMGASDRNGPLRFPSHQASIDYMAGRLASRTGPYRDANNLRELWQIYSPTRGPGGGPVGNDPHNLNRHWGPAVERFTREYERALGLRP